MGVRGKGWLAVALCLAAAMLEGFDIQSMGVAAPRMAPALGLTPEQTGWAFSAGLLGLMVGAAFGGMIADRRGRKPQLVASVALFGAFSLATAFVRDYPSLLAVRVLTGVGLGGAMPMLIAMAAEWASPRRRAFMVTLVTCGMPLGGAMAGLLARTPLGLADWRLVFVAGGIAPLLLFPLLVLWLPETQALSGEIKRTPGVRRVLFAEGRAPATALLWTSYALTALVLHLLVNWLPSLVVAQGFEAKAGAGTAMAFNLGGAAGSLAVGWSIDRLGARRALGVVFAALAAVLAAMATPALALPVIDALAFAAGFLVIGGQLGLYSQGPVHYPAAGRGTGVGAAVAAARLGSIAGPLAAGVMLGAGVSPGQVVISTAPIILAAGVAAVLLTAFGKRP